MWKNGKTLGDTSWDSLVVGNTMGESPILTPSCSQLTPILLWLSITPFGKPVVPDENGKNVTSSGWRLCGRNKLKSTSTKENRSINRTNSIYTKIHQYLLFVLIRSAKLIAPLGMDSSFSVLMQTILMFLLLFSTACFIVANVFGVPMITFASLNSSWRWISSGNGNHLNCFISIKCITIFSLQ